MPCLWAHFLICQRERLLVIKGLMLERMEEEESGTDYWWQGAGGEKSELIEAYVRVTILTPWYLDKGTSNYAIMKCSVLITS